MRERWWHNRRAESAAALTWLVAGLLLGGCGGLMESERALPPDMQDPDETRTPEGALAAYYGVRLKFRGAFGFARSGATDAANTDAANQDGVVVAGALLTDEFGSAQYGEPIAGQPVDLDYRYLPEGASQLGPYVALHQVRGGAREAIGLLATYAPDISPALRGHLYALAAYAEVFLADLYCSGIPLSTLDFRGDYTLRPGSPTDSIYWHAVTLFDTALTLAADNARFLHLAQVGRGRALLALGRYAEAAQAVAAVPDGFADSIEYDRNRKNFMSEFNLRLDAGEESATGPGTMTDREGGNGLPYRSSGDPRVTAIELGDNRMGHTIYLPAKYPENGAGPLVLADWVEARLIEAEAALQARQYDVWLAKLNHLRQSAWPTIVPPVDGALPDTTDPGPAPDGSDSLRVDLTFRERAFWLFLTGHRQGDLRRLVRHYGRSAEQLYPSGLYPGGFGRYGSDITLPVPPAEREQNPHYTGCLHRGA